MHYLAENTEPDGARTVHTAQCTYMSSDARKQYLGVFSGCVDAVREARRICPYVKGGVYCCRLEEEGLQGDFLQEVMR
ncbi:hypothetical protein J9T78_004409 [Salmonella enterica]|nr:hypothetical protein [Salmonella enterica]EHO4426045.1 hypothetical protein [Salmonella enterica]